jgi:hypothetical protein
MNNETYIDNIRRLMDEVRRKCSEKLRTKNMFLLHDNAPAHRSVLVKNFLAKNNVTKWSIPHTLLIKQQMILARVKSALKGRRFCYATVIIKNAMKDMKMLSQNGFQKCFYHLYSR